MELLAFAILILFIGALAVAFGADSRPGFGAGQAAPDPTDDAAATAR